MPNKAEQQHSASGERPAITSPEVFQLVRQVLAHHQTAYAQFHCTEGRKVIESLDMAIGSASVFLEQWLARKIAEERQSAQDEALEKLEPLVEAFKRRSERKSSCGSCSFEQSAYESCADELAAAIRAMKGEENGGGQVMSREEAEQRWPGIFRP